jgi:simple sugar transport system ATP-binding protein
MDVELRNINKHFGKVHANNDISLTIRAGEIQGILGENGAGKSTLMKIFSGLYQADSGKIVINNQPVVISSPADSVKLGIGMLHQDPLDFPPMRVIDNFITGSPVGTFPDRKKVLKDFDNLKDQFHFSISPDSYIEKLTVGERQQLEIMRLLWLGAEILILDEPTTGISATQKKQLFDTVKKLAKQGKSVVFVSHKLEEVEELCTQVAVFRQGKNIGQMKPPFDTDKLVEMMFGKMVTKSDKECCSQADLNFEIHDLSIDDPRLPIKDVSFTIKKGEVIGFAGMEGSGQSQVLKALAGIIRPSGGKILIHEDGKKKENLTGKHYFYFKESGISFLPASRLEEGLIAGLNLTEHIILAEKQSGFFIDQKSAQKITEHRIREFNIKGTPDKNVELLSGGNQQRAELALLREPLKLLLLENPTRGLDIESSIYIWKKMKQRCKEGASVVFISSDLDEVIHYSDRIIVFFGGKVSKPFDAGKVTVDQLGQLIGGKGWS